MFRQNSKHIIALGFLLVLALLIALAAVGLTRMAAINHHMELIAHKHNAKIDLLQSMRNIVRERSLSMYAMLHTDDPFQRDEEFTRFTDMVGEFIHLREQLVRTGLDSKDQEIFEKVLALIRETQPLQVSLVDKIIREDLAGVREEINLKDLPRERQILSYFDEMIEEERQEAREAVALASREYRQALTIMTLLVFSALVFGALIAWYVIYRIRLIEGALAREKEQAEVTLHSVGDAVVTADELGNVTYLNPVAEQLTGWRKEEALGQPLRRVYYIVNEITRRPLEHPAMLGVLDAPIAGLDKQTILVNRAGKEFAVEDTASPIRNNQGEINGAILVFRDVTLQHHMQKQLSWQASHDSLTGLVNRREFEVLLERLLASAKEQHKHHALLYLDLDQFKVINDTCGHVAGDELLKQATGVMQPLIRSCDTLARLGGDEFGVLLEGCGIKQAGQVAQKLHEAMHDFRFVWREKTFRIGVSIGLVGLHARSGTHSSMLSAADAACYMAKEKGRNRIWIHQENDSEAASRHGEMEWVSRITQAFDDNRFRLYFQRIVPLGAGVADDAYCELLIRMLDKDGVVVPPMAFIPAAERYGVMTEIDRWVVRHAFGWLVEHPDSPGFSINLSGQSIGNEHFLDFVMGEFNRGVSPGKVCFEITETVAIANWTRASHFISVLKGMGCRFALDDFGSGMSSFAYLKSLPVDFIKIDGGFVRDMVSDRVDRAMVEMINHIGHVMGIQTIAEYVENDQIAEALMSMGVDYVQGFGIHSPQPLEALEREPGYLKETTVVKLGQSRRRRGRKRSV